MYKLLMFRSTCLLSAILFLPAIVMAGEGDERFREGYQHYNRSRWKEAADSFATFTTSFPDHSNAAVASFFRAESLLQLKDHQAAGQQYEQFLVQHPGHQYQRHAEFRVAETAFLSARFTKAELELRQFQRRYPDTELINYVMVYLGETQLALGKTEPAEGTFQRALEQFSDNDLGPRYQLGLARALLAQDKEEGEQLIAKIFTTLSTDLVDDAMFARASYKYRHESYVECEQICLQIIQDFPKSDLRPQVDHRLGTAIAEQGRYEESARLLVA
ncbi:MAG: TolA-binding protein, partial [Pirellulaceae bacterium]